MLNVSDLAYEENSLGRFLKENGKADRTKAGRMMVAVGKTMSYSGQQRLAIRVPLVRLYQVRRGAKRAWKRDLTPHAVYLKLSSLYQFI